MITHLIPFLLPIIYYILANSLFVLLFKKSFGKCIPITLIVTAITLYISVYVFNTLKIGYIINLLIPLISVGLILYKLIKKQSIKEFLDNYFSYGFMSFLLIGLAFTFFDFRRSFTAWDEFSHWGVMVKNILKLDNFYSVDASTLLVHKDYPPIVPLFETFWIKLSTNGYSEAVLSQSIHILEMSMLIPAITDKIKKKNMLTNIARTILITITAYLIIVHFDLATTVNTIYIDYLLGIVTAYGLFYIANQKDVFKTHTLISICIISSFLLLMKQMGLPFYLLLLLTFFLSYIFHRKDISVNWKSIFKTVLLIMIIPLLFNRSWSLYTKNHTLKQQFNLQDIKIMELYDIIYNKAGEEWQGIAGRNYVSSVITADLSTSDNTITYFGAVLITLAVLSILYIVYKKEDKNIFINLSITLSVGSIGYYFTLLLLYVFSFGPDEGPRLASLGRYLDTYLVLMFITVLLLFYYLNAKYSKHKVIYAFLLVVILFNRLPQNKMEFLRAATSKGDYFPYKTTAESLENRLNYEQTRIYAMTKDYGGTYFTNYYTSTFQFEDQFEYEDAINNPEYIKEVLNNFDYFYLQEASESFVDKFSFLFDNVEEISNDTIYRIVKANNSIKLKSIDIL
ncbi:hypothetical protein J6Z48_03270 [bacterium]|nr:hypothetical protein [bacterium]